MSAAERLYETLAATAGGPPNVPLVIQVASEYTQGDRRWALTNQNATNARSAVEDASRTVFPSGDTVVARNVYVAALVNRLEPSIQAAIFNTPELKKAADLVAKAIGDYITKFNRSRETSTVARFYANVTAAC